MSALALSVLLSLVSAVAYAGGAIVQEQVAVSSPVAQYAPLRRPAWWAAVALNGLGGLLHVVALALGPLSLVQPLGALTIVFALPMAALFVGRRAGATAWRGALMATVGLAGLLSLVGASGAQSLNTAQRVGAALVTGGVVVALMIAGRAAHRHPAVRSILLATASGIAFGMSSVFTKTVAVDWTGGVSATDLPSLAVIGVLATAGMVLSQASYRGAGLAAPLATLTVVNPVVAAVVGITMFGETFRYGTTGTALALSCGVVAAGGLILLTTERIARESAGEAASDATPADGAPADPAPVKEEPAGGAPVAVAAAAARVQAERAALVSVAGSGTVPAVAGSGTVPAPVAQARSRKRAADEERERRDEQSARLSGKVLVPASAADAPAAEETFDALVSAPGPGPGPAEGDYPPPSFGPFYGGPFVPPPAFGRRGVRIRS
ncbi:DMT family transporter [Streptomyces olivaceus]|uniref:DMT family transporter n=1 Tax=Streptomyces olivaceus TaxID=47716 RepID=A0ABS7VYF0_STROV|nr:DMT family transporter [Streptomyces olivaceus]MBZ6087893.1 DMT family transporter [Streptomyces olivaceus]MBZ6095271.1 DMT family transporter [Streptomyces olivaceus]MBZ6116031.1 DMT family transporter [Streptomyces olivaceus]MBZ6150737.1 DMT family transporter [Streptomyces olivaceus]MBZ6297678.1 DMT family transporter [Streptomyces olivaceus]